MRQAGTARVWGLGPGLRVRESQPRLCMHKLALASAFFTLQPQRSQHRTACVCASRRRRVAEKSQPPPDAGGTTHHTRTPYPSSGFRVPPAFMDGLGCRAVPYRCRLPHGWPLPLPPPPHHRRSCWHLRSFTPLGPRASPVAAAAPAFQPGGAATTATAAAGQAVWQEVVDTVSGRPYYW